MTVFGPNYTVFFSCLAFLLQIKRKVCLILALSDNRKSFFDLKLDLEFKIELQFRNRASVSRSNFYIKLKIRFQNGASNSKSNLDIEIDL